MRSALAAAACEQETDLLSRIGNTPLIRLTRITHKLHVGVELHAKAEWFNPGGSVKDRAALGMILEGERRGLLTKGKTILDATSGNTGIAYAMIAAVRGYRVCLCLSSKVSPERKRILSAYGAELVMTDPAESSDGAIRKARELFAANPDRYFYPDQYNNAANRRAHYLTTGREIYAQTGGRVTHFVAGIGTTGTFTGTGRRLKEYNPMVQLISVQPDSGMHGMEGLKHLETAIVPGIYDPALASSNMSVGTEEAYEMVRLLARKEGMLVGISSGAASACALRIAETLKSGVVVTLFPDSGERYLSGHFWEEGK